MNEVKAKEREQLRKLIRQNLEVGEEGGLRNNTIFKALKQVEEMGEDTVGFKDQYPDSSLMFDMSPYDGEDNPVWESVEIPGPLLDDITSSELFSETLPIPKRREDLVKYRPVVRRIREEFDPARYLRFSMELDVSNCKWSARGRSGFLSIPIYVEYTNRFVEECMFLIGARNRVLRDVGSGLHWNPKGEDLSGVFGLFNERINHVDGREGRRFQIGNLFGRYTERASLTDETRRKRQQSALNAEVLKTAEKGLENRRVVTLFLEAFRESLETNQKNQKEKTYVFSRDHELFNRTLWYYANDPRAYLQFDEDVARLYKKKLRLSEALRETLTELDTEVDKVKEVASDLGLYSYLPRGIWEDIESLPMTGTYVSVSSDFKHIKK